MRALNWSVSVLAMALSPCLAFGAIFHNLDTTKPLSCVFSWSNHNRVMVEKGSILKVIVPDNRFYVRLEPESGQAFFQAMYSFHDVVTASIVTDGGVVQDIEIVVEDVPSEVVILREPIPQEQPDMGRDRHDTATVTAKTYLDSGGILNGYVQRPVSVISDRVYKDLVMMSPIKVLEGPFEYICEMQVESRSSKPVTLNEIDIIRPGDRWVYISKHRLVPGSSTTVIFSMEKDRG